MLVKFDKDFILKTALTLIGAGAKYEVKKFKRDKGKDNLASIEAKWSDIESSMLWTIDFIRDNAYIRGDQALPSYNVLIPVIYYAFIKKQNIDLSEYNNIFVWIYSALLNRNFSGQSDNVIDSCIDALQNNKRIFP